MRTLSDEIIKGVFKEETSRIARWLREQKRHLRSWIVLVLLILLYIFFRNIEAILPYVYLRQQFVFNVVVFAWIITIVLIPFLWPQKPGEFFKDYFKKGLDPKVWEYDGDWKVELDEESGPVLSVKNSDRGGLALPCLSWTDYELIFEARMVTEWIGWIVRASSLSEYVHQKLGPKSISTLYRMSGIIRKVGELEHNLSIEPNKWYRIRLLARGEWLSVHIRINRKEHLIFQDRALGEKPPVAIELRSEQIEIPMQYSKQILAPSYRSGSFGFRLHDVEHAHYRRLRAYHL